MKHPGVFFVRKVDPLIDNEAINLLEKEFDTNSEGDSRYWFNTFNNMDEDGTQ